MSIPSFHHHHQLGPRHRGDKGPACQRRQSDGGDTAPATGSSLSDASPALGQRSARQEDPVLP